MVGFDHEDALHHYHHMRCSNIMRLNLSRSQLAEMANHQVSVMIDTVRFVAG